MMPEMDGYETTQAIREREEWHIRLLKKEVLSDMALVLTIVASSEWL